MRNFKQPSKLKSLILKVKALLGLQKPEPPKPPKGTFSLTVQQVAAMKAAGIWNDPARRDRMIRRYATEAVERAPYGLTKDGVPKKKPGRKPKPVVRGRK
jgi:hypothetical protein